MKQLIMQRLGEPPPDGARLNAKLIGIDGLDEQAPLKTKYGACLRFRFAPADERFAGRTISALTSATLNEHSRLGLVLTAMLEREIADGEDVLPAVRALIGRHFTITVRHEDRDGTLYLRASDPTPAEP